MGQDVTCATLCASACSWWHPWHLLPWQHARQARLQRRRLILTFGFAGLADRVHLVARVTFTLEVPFEVDADLAAGVRILTLIDI